MQDTIAPEKDVFHVRNDNIDDFKTNMTFMITEVSTGKAYFSLFRQFFFGGGAMLHLFLFSFCFP